MNSKKSNSFIQFITVCWFSKNVDIFCETKAIITSYPISRRWKRKKIGSKLCFGFQCFLLLFIFLCFGMILSLQILSNLSWLTSIKLYEVNSDGTISKYLFISIGTKDESGINYKIYKIHGIIFQQFCLK